MTFVYFVRVDSKVKIGVSCRPQHRFHALSTACPSEPEMLGVMPGSVELESQIHKKFARVRTHGEWFDLTSDLREYIAINTTIPDWAKKRNGRRYARTIFKSARAIRQDDRCAQDKTEWCGAILSVVLMNTDRESANTCPVWLEGQDLAQAKTIAREWERHHPRLKTRASWAHCRQIANRNLNIFRELLPDVHRELTDSEVRFGEMSFAPDGRRYAISPLESWAETVHRYLPIKATQFEDHSHLMPGGKRLFIDSFDWSMLTRMCFRAWMLQAEIAHPPGTLNVSGKRSLVRRWRVDKDCVPDLEPLIWEHPGGSSQ